MKRKGDSPVTKVPDELDGLGDIQTEDAVKFTGNPRDLRNSKAITPTVRSDDRRAYDMIREMSLYVKHWTYKQIADDINARAEADGYEYTVSVSQVCRDIQQIHAEYRRRLDVMAEDYMTQELARIDRMEAEAWAAWDESKGGNKLTETESVVGVGGTGKIKPGDKIRRRAVSSPGDPRYLAELRQLMETRMKLLGFSNGYKKQAPIKEDEPEPLTPTNMAPQSGYNIKALTPAEIKEFADKMQRQRAEGLNPQNVLNGE